MEISRISLEADCSQCAALCCVALAFDKSEQFAFDKPADQPCPNLANSGRCSVHENLEDLGFGGCVLYECDGAGQRVTQEVFAGARWQENTELLPRMTQAFRVMKKVHELLVLLGAAKQMPLSVADLSQAERLCGKLNPTNGWSEGALKAFESGSLTREVRVFLAGLRGYVKKGQE